jgi:hypothetical protein
MQGLQRKSNLCVHGRLWLRVEQLALPCPELAEGSEAEGSRNPIPPVLNQETQRKPG